MAFIERETVSPVPAAGTGGWEEGKICAMHRHGHHRFRIAIVVVLCLLFQQAAMAAYACPLDRMPADPVTMAADCASMGMEQALQSPVLCATHCAPDRSVAADHAMLGVPALALPAIAYALLAPHRSQMALIADVPVDRSDPPPRLRYCSLQI